jgi:adenine-specific DNA-methyltransferase
VKKRRRNNPPSEGPGRVAESYAHYEARSPMRPDAGTQPQFRKKKPPRTYRYDSSLAPALSWDGQNPARELGEWLLDLVERAAALPAPHAFEEPQEFRTGDGTLLATVRTLGDAVEQLKRLGKPFLDWAGKAERLSFDVPTLPLFIHERLSTKAIVETLVGHRREKQQDMFELFGDPRHSITDQVLKAYEYEDRWVNRLVLGDSLVVMNSLLQYEGLGGQVQMIYMDPPYGVRFGSNFQPFVRRRDVSHNDDEDMTREPEMVKAYRDTWELGLHSYLTYMRDRLLLARDLLSPSGSIFVQISDENLHHVREVMDEVFGGENFCAVVNFRKTGGASSPTAKTKVVGVVSDYLLWYARDKDRVRYRQLYSPRAAVGDKQYRYLEEASGQRRPMNDDEAAGRQPLPSGTRVFRVDQLSNQGLILPCIYEFALGGRKFLPPKGRHWATTPEGMARLLEQRRVVVVGSTPSYVRYHDDFGYVPLMNWWEDTVISGFGDAKVYAVQTSFKAVQRCILMTTDPGDLVLDPTCGSGTTAYVAEQWGRRWIAIDTSRVPLALTRQRLLTATFPYYQLKDEARGPASGFVYVRRQNKKGEEVGGIVPHVTLKSIANDEPPEEEVLVDRPEVDNRYVRVTGPFTVEATIPAPVDWEGDGVEDSGAPAAEEHESFVDRMLEVLRKSPVLHVGGGRAVTLRNVRPPAKTLSLSAEAVTANGDEKAVALAFGPENGAISQLLVNEALKEAYLKGYAHLYVIGFAIQPDARMLIERAAEMGTVPATYVQATPDLMMGDLLKNMRSSQIFSVCGLPEVRVRKVRPERKGDPPRYQAELLGLDLFDPVTMTAEHRPAADVPAWFLDTDYNGLCFHVSQAFFPKTGAWEGLKRALRGEYDESVWDHLAGAASAPFNGGEHGQVAVKVIDDRGNELLVVKSLTEAEP